MKFNLKLALLFGLVAKSFAAPLADIDVVRVEERDVVNLESRAPGVVPENVNCGGVRITRAQILAALHASFTPALSKQKKKYPAYYGNKGKDSADRPISVLTNSAALRGERSRTLQEQPIGRTQTWTGGDLRYVGASLYRVIFDTTVSDAEGSYIGVVYHPGGDEGGKSKACIEEAAPACQLPARTRTRSLWGMVRRAVGTKPAKKPTKTPANCGKPRAKKPKSKKPATKKPTTTKPKTKKPTTKKPKTKKPATKKPATKKPKNKKPKKGGRA